MTSDFDPGLLQVPPEEKAELDSLLTSNPVIWRPLPAPQTQAYEPEADIIGYGGLGWRRQVPVA
jgi:hypothetical protein